MSDLDLSERRRRLRFRAWRRGFKEADLLLGGFADARLDGLDAEELGRFEALLNEDDQTLYAWIARGEPADPDHEHALLDALRAFCAAGGAGEASLKE